jgi:hypothetical protein
VDTAKNAHFIGAFFLKRGKIARGSDFKKMADSS